MNSAYRTAWMLFWIGLAVYFYGEPAFRIALFSHLIVPGSTMCLAQIARLSIKSRPALALTLAGSIVLLSFGSAVYFMVLTWLLGPGCFFLFLLSFLWVADSKKQVHLTVQPHPSKMGL